MFPKTQVITKATPFHSSFFTSLSPNVVAFWRLTTSLSWGWRHLPGVPDPSEARAAAGAALGVEGADCVAIGRVQQTREEKSRSRKIQSRSCDLGISECPSLIRHGDGSLTFGTRTGATYLK